ncbi:MAG: hypothetical protein ACLP36_05385 [Acidimicrobiales bacterium]
MSTKETVSGVFGGVFPNGVAPGNEAALMPGCTGVIALELGLDATAAVEPATSGSAIAAATRAIPVNIRK